MKDLGSKTMHKVAITLAGALERTEDVLSDIRFRFDTETSVCNIMVKLRRFSRLTEICIKQIPTRSKDAIHGFEKSILARIAMRSFDIDDGIKMPGWEIKRLGITNAKIDTKRGMCLKVVI